MLDKPAPHTSVRATGPLAGTRIVEFAGIGPGPFACMMLADMGAEVVTLDRIGAKKNLKGVSLRGRKVVELDLTKPSAPVVSNHDAEAYDDADGWRERLPSHVSVPVRWRSTMDTLVTLGATQFWEVGHGSMLAALAKRGAPDVTVRNVATPEDLTLEVE